MNNEHDVVTPTKAGPTIRTVDMNRGVEWLIVGFRAFSKAPVPMGIAGFGMLVGAWLLGKIGMAWMGGSLVTIFFTVAVGALMRSCVALEEGRDPAVAMQTAFGFAPLWILGLISAGLSIGMSMVASVLGLGSLLGGVMSPVAMGGLVGISLIVLFALSVLLLLALWLAPALVVLKGVTPAQAIRASLTASIRNIVPTIIFTLLAMLATFFGALLFGLGLIVVFPVLVFATYTAYKDMFVAVSPLEGIAHMQDED
jgi:hypothetical protein